MKMKAMITGILLSALSSFVIAHPGHGPIGEHDHGLLHPFVGLEHVLLFAALGLAALLLPRFLGSQRDQEE